MDNEKFNKIDDASSCISNIIPVVNRIPEHVADYFQGRMRESSFEPQNILFFKRTVSGSLAAKLSSHHRFLLILCLEGHGTVLVDDHALDLEPGAALLVFPFQYHHYANINESSLLWLFISFEMTENDQMQVLRGKTFKLDALGLNNLCWAANLYADHPDRHDKVPEIGLILSLIMHLLLRTCGGDTNDYTTPNSLLRNVVYQIHHNLDSPFGLPDLAKILNISESHLRAQFRAQAGISLGKYIRHMRLHRASILLRLSDLRIHEIATQCGFDTIYSFSRAFKQRYHASPSDYRHNR